MSCPPCLFKWFVTVDHITLSGTHVGITFSIHLLSGTFPSLRQVGTFTLFQETYHRPTFKKMHISGPKSDYDYRLLSQDRAMIGGVDDVGIGALFGLVGDAWCLM